ncbi:MAG: hypothetical protein ACKOYH_05950 [Cyanobium sp.]
MGGRQRRLWLAGALGLALVLQLLLTPAAALALGWSFPGKGGKTPSRSAPPPALQRLQEVPPPEWVQQLQGALEEKDPHVRILSPAPDSLVPEGPWTLRFEVSDWPLVDAGPLGLGPHLVVQLDGQVPIPVVEKELAMPPLTPGSHLLTVYAAKPWGEAHKGPSALQQIRLHRLAENPVTLPAPGTPQLLPVSPTGPAGDPPLLLDWLLLDAPLQGLRTDSLGWRLRVTLNGESVLLDRQTPLWLKGWTSGSNALLLELLDGRGEMLNSPFNSLLQEVIVPGSAGVRRPHPGRLTPLEIAVLLGEQPPSVLLPPPPPDATEPPPNPAEVLPPQEQEEEPQDQEEPQQPLVEEPSPSPQEPMADADSPPAPGLLEEEEPPPAPPAPPAPPVAPVAPVAPEALPDPTATPPPATLSARDEVNPDGTLKRPARSSPLERLKQRWNR